MRKTALSTAALVAAIWIPANAAAQERDFSFVINGSAAWSVMPVPPSTVKVTWDFKGNSIGESDDIGAHAGVWCLGNSFVVDGKWEDEHGVCRLSYGEDDRIFLILSGTEGGSGQPLQGEVTIVGGTGKFDGVSGKGEFVRTGMPAPTGGFGASRAEYTGTYRMP